MKRRAVLIAIVLTIAVLWGFVPYGQKNGGDYKSFGSEVLRSVGELTASHGPPPRAFEAADAVVLPVGLLGAFGPLYPAVQAALLLVAPGWVARRRRWVWLIEGVLLLLAAPAAQFCADFSLAEWMWGVTTGPHLFAPYWLLPGAAALAGLVACAVGIAPRSRFSGFILGAPRQPNRGK